MGTNMRSPAHVTKSATCLGKRPMTTCGWGRRLPGTAQASRPTIPEDSNTTAFSERHRLAGDEIVQALLAVAACRDQQEAFMLHLDAQAWPAIH